MAKKINRATLPFPNPAFSFTADIEGTQTKFAEISGLKSTIEFKDVRHGGSNDYQYKIPTHISYGDVVFKRGIMFWEEGGPTSSELFKSVFTNILKLDSADHMAKQYQDIKISLLSDASLDDLVVQWVLKNPCLISWELSPFNASANEIAFETLTFSVGKLVMDYI